MDPKKCRNCSNAYSGNYCTYCGQRDIANHRLQWREVIADFFDNFFNFDKGFLFTLWKLLIQPGKVGRNFINGKRKKFTNPIRYLIIAIAVQAFMDYWFLQASPGSYVDFFQFPFLSEEINQRMAIINHLMAINLSSIYISSSEST